MNAETDTIIPPDRDRETPEEHVREALERKGTARRPRIVQSPQNVALVLSTDSRWRGRLWYDEFAQAPHLDGERLDRASCLPSAREAAEWVRLVYGLDLGNNVGRFLAVMRGVAMRHQRHPVRAYLHELLHGPNKWDGVERMRSWLPDYLGAADTDLVRSIGRRFLVSGVARIYNPGCPVDGMMVLFGSQGSGKTSAMQALCRPWFGDASVDPSAKDAADRLRGVWIQEVADLDSFTGRRIAGLKAFISARSDRQGGDDVPRQCVLYGTSSSPFGLLREATGRLILPVVTGKVDVEGLRSVRDQLWAEAVHAYLNDLDRPRTDALAEPKAAPATATATRRVPVSNTDPTQPPATIADHLNKLEWDGGERLNAWLTHFLGVELTPRTAVLGRKWMIAAVARALQPGCEVPWALVIETADVDTSLVLEVLSLLGQSFGAVTEPPGFDARDAAEAKVARWWAWITVHAEVPSNGMALHRALSLALSPSDRYRKAFTTEVRELPRSGIVVFLSMYAPSAMSDSRRVHVVRATRPAPRSGDGPSDAARAVQEKLVADRHQLLAEAVVAFRAGESWQVPS